MDSESSWSVSLADYIRNNDQSLQDASKKVLAMFQDELMPCETFAEFCDVAGTLQYWLSRLQTRLDHLYLLQLYVANPLMPTVAIWIQL